MNRIKLHIILILLTFLVHLPLCAQWDKRESVLKDHTWLKIGVVEDGIYAIDQATLSSMGVDAQSLNPMKIRLFSNEPGMLPEPNSAPRYDDLTEVPIQVEGAMDGSFDEQDRILFYGHGPVNMTWSVLGYFDYERNSYTDTIYYFLCVDDEVNGLRISEKDVHPIPEGSAVITRYPDYRYHESEEMSPYASGRRWYGDLITPLEGFKEFEYEIPDLIQTEVLRIKSRVFGRCASNFGYNMQLNDNLLADQVNIAAYGSHKYGTEHEINKMAYVDSDQVTIRYSLAPTTENPMLYIDYFSFTCWRELRFRGGEMGFTIVPSLMETPTAEVQVRNLGTSTTCWDVTDPIHPYLQPLTQQGNVSSFGVDSLTVKRFHLFDPSAIRTVASCYPISNQNLHAVTEAEMLIISPRLFWDQANEIAQFHRDADGMDCLVVDINEIYNEFGTGMADPTAMRDFIRMVYLRSNAQLKYVLLMGKGTHDYRDIKGFGNNFVPTYENTERPWFETVSICTDDYFALMDDLEGDNCVGRVDIGIGRFPITTPEQGDDVIRKIKHYTDLSESRGLWKSQHFFLADNDSRTYTTYCEDLNRILDTTHRQVTSKKLYTESYPVVKTPSGERVPEAHDALMRAFDEGFAVMSYTGHGGVKALMQEQILSASDVIAMDNYDRLPFVHTATCEFSKFDNPNMISAGEQMFTNPYGGAIGMLTTVRPTYAPDNQSLSKSFHIHAYELDNGLPRRLGDIVRISKSDAKYYTIKNLCYYLFGDPAMRLGIPRGSINTLTVNGENAFGVHALHATDKVTVEGVIALNDFKIDTLFNGVVDIRLYDKKVKYTTSGVHFNPAIEYAFYNDVLFEGQATVTDGHFTVQFQLPLEVNYSSGSARLCYYAYDSIRNKDAAGVYDKLRITAADASATLDNKGPEIHLYWNTPEFNDGDVVSRNGVLYADLFDEQGIYHYNVSIGRDILLNSSIDEFDNVVLNERYEPFLDDYQRGRIVIPIDDLSNGSHEFKLKAWDTQDNSSEVKIVLVVEDGIMMAEVHNTPNPFTEGTYFTFLHGDKTEAVSVRIEVFDLLGRRVADLNEQTSATAGVVPPIYWNGCSNNGQRLKAGVYVYRLSVTDPHGKTLTVSRRLVIG